jgi:hypothetical protein
MIVAAALLGLSLTVTPASVDAQQDGRIQRIGIIAGSSSPSTTLAGLRNRASSGDFSSGEISVGGEP